MIKALHMLLAALTAVSFSLRGVWMLMGSSLLQHKLTRVLPHVIDALLLATGLTLAVTRYGAFYHQPWLLGKLTALVVYIVLGSIALKYGKTKTIRASALVLSLSVLAYIVLVARTHSLLPYLV